MKKPTEDVLKRLRQKEAQLVIVDMNNKRPLYLDWRRARIGWRQARDAVKRGYCLGLVPVSVGCLVVDVDVAGHDSAILRIEAQYGPAVCRIETPSGGRHLYYRYDEDVFLRDVRQEGVRQHRRRPLPPDVRYDSGYVILWDAEAVADALDALDQHQSIDLIDWFNGGEFPPKGGRK